MSKNHPKPRHKLVIRNGSPLLAKEPTDPLPQTNFRDRSGPTAHLQAKGHQLVQRPSARGTVSHPPMPMHTQWSVHGCEGECRAARRERRDDISALVRVQMADDKGSRALQPGSRAKAIGKGCRCLAQAVNVERRKVSHLSRMSVPPTV